MQNIQPSHLFIEKAYGKDEFIETVKSNLSNILFNAHKMMADFYPLSPMPYDQTYGTNHISERSCNDSQHAWLFG